jgi:spermidine synthase
VAGDPVDAQGPDGDAMNLRGPAGLRVDVYSCTSPYHTIHVTDDGYIRALRFMRNRQSSMYLDAPFDTDFEYPGYFHIALAVKPAAARTLVIGLGGATVVKRMWRDYPEMRIDAVELDPDVVYVAHRFFALPDDERIRIFVGDGRGFLESGTDSYDVAIVDAFDEDQVPRPLTTEEFMRTLRDRLAPDGVVSYNFIGTIKGAHSKPFRSLYRTLRNVWRTVWVFVAYDGVDAEGVNLMLFATDAPVTTDELLARIADRVGGLVTVPAFERYGEQLYAGEIRSGDAPLIVDPPRRRSGRRR